MCLLYVVDNMPRAPCGVGENSKGLLRLLYICRGGIFNERAARRSRSTSRFGCLYIYLRVCPLLHEQLRNNFKVELQWLPLTESTQIFLCDSVCLLYVSDNMSRAPRARGHVHVPFYEGTCQNLFSVTGGSLEFYIRGT